MKVGSERTISKGPKPCWEFKDTTRQETRAVRRGTRGGRVEEEGMVEEEKSARWRTCAGLYNSRHKGHGSTQNPHPPWQICCTSLLSLISVRYGLVQIEAGSPRPPVVITTVHFEIRRRRPCGSLTLKGRTLHPAEESKLFFLRGGSRKFDVATVACVSSEKVLARVRAHDCVETSG